MATTADLLYVDELQVPGQNYALLSVVSPTSSQKTDVCAAKIRGVFRTIDEAKAHAAKLNQIDSMFDVFVVEMYKWLPIPPDVNGIDDATYTNDMLTNIIGTHIDQQSKSKDFFEQRKRDLMDGKIDPIDGTGVQFDKPDESVAEKPAE